MLSNHRPWLTLCLGAALSLSILGCEGSGTGTELVFVAESPARSGEGQSAATFEEARRVALARLAALEIPGTVVIDGRSLRMRIPKKASAQLDQVKAVMAIQGRLEFREVDDGSALKAIAGKLGEESGTKVESLTWTDHNQRQRGAYVVTAETERAAREALAVIPELKLADGVELLLERPMVPDRVRLYLVREARVGNDLVKEVSAPRDPYLSPEVAVAFSPEGTDRFAQLTRQLLGRQLAIVLDGRIQETTAVLTAVTGGRVSITPGDAGDDRKVRQQKADVLAAALRGGVLPVALKLSEERAFSKR